jgi:predicted ATPase
MPRIIITGAPGAGKTTLIDRLARAGHPTVGESAREVIRERRARGEPPRPPPEAFAHEVHRRDLQRHDAHPAEAGWVFFDRSAVESLGLLHGAAPREPAELDRSLAALHYHRTVFLLPPWEAIYCTDAERDHPFAHALAVHDRLVAWYRRCGYRVDEVPFGSVDQRAAFVLAALAALGEG